LTSSEPIPPTIEWRNGTVRLLDQRALPARVRFVVCKDVETLCEAIATLAVRGAPALGAAGAYGVALAAHTHATKAHVRAAARRITKTRPTAVNLAWGVNQALAAYERDGRDGALACAQVIARDEVERNGSIGAHGAPLLPVGGAVLTHCNTGALACVGYGTALGVIRAAHEAGRRPQVWADETRPLLQGARLTMWECDRLGIDATLVPDGAAASLMARGLVDAAIVGADRIAANGDTANKIGTYGVAVAARAHQIPFYVAAPTSTVDLATPSGADITIEERDPEEVLRVGSARTAPEGAKAYNPAFDVTPARLVTAIITEAGICRPPYHRSLPAAVKRAQ
jgi:methylthioribose-1-phosphate isomerase